MEVLDRLNETEESHPFGGYEEEAIASLIIDHPEFFSAIMAHMSYELFARPQVQFVIAAMMDYYREYDIIPSRGMLIDRIKRSVTVDTPDWEEIIAIAARESDPREVPALKDQILKWARSKSYGLIYDPETIDRYKSGDYEYLENVINKAKSVQDVGTGVFWFFDNIESLFREEDIERFTTGFTQLDRYLNDGGPMRKEVLVWMAATGVGKSIMLINNAISNILNNRKVLYITLELSDYLTAVRAIGALTKFPTYGRRFDYKEQMLQYIRNIRHDVDPHSLAIQEWAPDEVSVDHIYALIDHLRKTKGWVPDVICIDYLELMLSRRAPDNEKDYVRQKQVSTQVRGLAKNTNTMVFTATQTNRSGNDTSANIDVTKIAESYGKAMPMDYLISINQTEDQYNEQYDENTNVSVRPSPARAYIAKNRNGDKFKSVLMTINYQTMAIEETS